MAYLEEGGDGVSGWLGAFVVMIGIFTPLGVARELFVFYSATSGIDVEVLGSLWMRMQLFMWGLSITVVAICWYICWRLFRRQYWRTIPITIGLLWLVSVGRPAADILGVHLLTGMSLDLLIQMIGYLDYIPILLSIAWTLYFLMSKRVRFTYPRYADDEEVRQAFD